MFTLFPLVVKTKLKKRLLGMEEDRLKFVLDYKKIIKLKDIDSERAEPSCFFTQDGISGIFLAMSRE